MMATMMRRNMQLSLAPSLAILLNQLWLLTVVYLHNTNAYLLAYAYETKKKTAEGNERDNVRTLYIHNTITRSRWVIITVRNNCMSWESLHGDKIKLRLQVKGPIFLPDFNQLWILNRFLMEVPQYQISPKSVPWEPRQYIRTEEHGETHWRFSRLCDTRLKQHNEQLYSLYASPHSSLGPTSGG